MNQHYTAHLLQWKKKHKQLESFPPSEAICPHATFCATHCTCPSYPSVTVPCLSLLSSRCPPLYYHSVCALCSALTHCSLSIPLSSSTFPIHFYIFYLLSHLFASLSSYLQGHVCTQNGVLWPVMWYSKQSEDIPPPMKYVLKLCCHLCLFILSVSGVFHCTDRRLATQNTAIQYDAVFNFWT